MSAKFSEASKQNNIKAISEEFINKLSAKNSNVTTNSKIAASHNLDMFNIAFSQELSSHNGQ